jgi:hypothetical protein
MSVLDSLGKKASVTCNVICLLLLNSEVQACLMVKEQHYTDYTLTDIVLSLMSNLLNTYHYKA